MARSSRANASLSKSANKETASVDALAVPEHAGEPISPLAQRLPGGGPLWMPEGHDLAFVPPEVRHAMSCVVQPVYQRLVAESDDPLEKSLGLTVSHLLWLEILQQMDLKRDYTQVTAVLELAADHRPLIEQHLRILDTKVKVGYLLARLRDVRRRVRDELPGLLVPAGSLPAAALPSHSGPPPPPE